MTNKLFAAFAAVVIMSCAAGLCLADTLTNDPLTGLPLYPATDSRLHLGNEPQKLPDIHVCKSLAHTDFYAVYDSSQDATVAWYTAHLPGFHKTHAYYDNRSQDKFYNDAGTVVVTVLSERGKEGEHVGTHSVTYYTFQPGLPAAMIIAYGQRQMVCK